MHRKAIQRVYGQKLRVRVVGLCFSGDNLLLVKHKALTKKGYFFSPPGGGMQFGESAEDCLKREFLEETGLEIIVNRFLFTHEFLAPPLHAVELFFSVEMKGGTLKTGYDPEMNEQEQIIEMVDFFSPPEIDEEKGTQMHQIINLSEHPRDLLNMQGYFKFDDKTLK
ncbi:8-oxo-dGTP diphosphatase [Catalinimonas alkaloidigena]|uniref:NUDIX domain-containing protein n=1 Tax=Catalinimonas alkaloidigena TaxID=1075417 RepID=UPI0024052C6C|nr:NUDIX hydrolase [Catalinimonas alkaloidigena]MDF9800432.1 8-oxo-dGTP diphosphatase [Catalinimonas alkaloidigena]